MGSNGKRYSTAEKRMYLKAFLEAPADTSLRDFANMHHLNRTSLRNWISDSFINIYRQEMKEKKPQFFREALSETYTEKEMIKLPSAALPSEDIEVAVVGEEPEEALIPVRQRNSKICSPLKINYNGLEIELKKDSDLDSLRNVFRLIKEYF